MPCTEHVNSLLFLKHCKQAWDVWLFSLLGILLLWISISPLSAFFSRLTLVPSHLHSPVILFASKPAVSEITTFKHSPLLFSLLSFFSKALSTAEILSTYLCCVFSYCIISTMRAGILLLFCSLLSLQCLEQYLAPHRGLMDVC